MTPQMRNFYKLEKRWKEAEVKNIHHSPQTHTHSQLHCTVISTLPHLTSTDKNASFRTLVSCALPLLASTTVIIATTTTSATTITSTTQGVSFRVAIPANYAALCAVKRRYTITGWTPSDRTYRPPYRAEKWGSIWSRRGTHNFMSPVPCLLFIVYYFISLPRLCR
jgi:hypothetical protein